MESKTKIVYKTYNPFIYLFLTKDDMELTLFYPYTQKYSIDLWENLNIYRFPSLNNDEILLGCLCKFKLDENLIMNYNEDLFTACGFCHQKFNIIDKRKIKN